MRTYISPIGFNSTSVTRVVLSHGLDAGDQVVLVRPKGETDESRSEEAVGDVRRLLSEVEPELSLSVEQIPHDEFETATIQSRDLIRAAEGRVIVNLGGGARDVLLPFATAVLAEYRCVDRAVVFSDIDGRVRELELPELTASVSDSALNTLEAIDRAGGESSIPELTEVTGQSKSTVARHVDDLESSGTVETHREGKTKHVSITLTGRLLVGQE